MAKSENKEFLCIWKIENYSFAYQEHGHYIKSPLIRVSNLGGIDLTFLLYPRGYSVGVDVVSCMYRYHYKYGDESQKKFTIDLRFELMNSNDIIVKICEFQNQEISRGVKSKSKVFDLIKIDELQEEMKHWPNDTLIMRCYLIKTHDVMPLMQIGTPYSNCEAFTEICVDTFKHTWIIGLPVAHGWSRKKEIIFPEMLPIVISCGVSGDIIQIEISSKVKYKFSRFISCKVTFIDSKGEVFLFKEVARLFHNETWIFPGFIHKSILDLLTCAPHNDVKLNIEVSSTNDTLFSRINYYNEDLKESNDAKLHNTPLCDSEVMPGSLSNTGSLLQLQSHLKNMLTDSKFTDVSLKADNEVFPVHKALLAVRSPVFGAMFEQNMLESKTGVVEISDIEPKTLKLFLEYLYSGTIEEMNVDSSKNLLVVADKYEVLTLKEKCSEYLASVLSLNNVCDVIFIADMVNDASLKSAAIDYVVTNSVNVLPSPEWSSWVENNVKLATEIFSKLSQKFNNDSKNLFGLRR